MGWQLGVTAHCQCGRQAPATPCQNKFRQHPPCSRPAVPQWGCKPQALAAAAVWMGDRQAIEGAGARRRKGGACHAPAARLDPGLAEGVPASKRCPCSAEAFPYVLDVRNEAKMQAACSFRGNVQVLGAKHSAQAPKRGQLQVGRPAGIGGGSKRHQTRGRGAAPPSAGRWAPPLQRRALPIAAPQGRSTVWGQALGGAGGAGVAAGCCSY